MPNLASNNISQKFLVKNADKIALITKFMVFKKAFVNSKVYHYSPTKAHKLGRLPYSRNTINTTVKKFLDLGWARIENGHLILNSKHELYVETLKEDLGRLVWKGKRLKLWETKKKAAIEKKLQRKVNPLFIKLSSTSDQTLSRELRYHSLRSLCNRKKLSSGATPRRTKNINSRRKSQKISKPLFFKDGLSYSCIAKLFGVKKTNAYLLIKDLVDNKFIFKEKKKPLFHGKDRRILSSIKNSFVTKKGNICSIESNSYSFALTIPLTLVNGTGKTRPSVEQYKGMAMS